MRIEIKEDVHYSLELLGKVFVCLKCFRCFPSQYSVKQSQIKKYGTKQLMSLWAFYNFKRHVISCWEKKRMVP